MESLFEDYLKNEQSKYQYRQIALTATSYKNIDHSLNDGDTNSALATYGDALLKLAFCKILFEEKVKNITVQKQKYESDEILVKIIAKRYDLLNYIRFDEKDKKIPTDYDYKKTSNMGKDSPHKYIATTVESLLAAIYLDHDEKFDLVVDIVKEWRMLIDNSENS